MVFMMKGGDEHFRLMAEKSMGEAGSLRVQSWLREANMDHTCRIGVVAVLNTERTRLDAWAKVIVPGGASFEHRELYITFPSDHFKTKVLLATGGA